MMWVAASLLLLGVPPDGATQGDNAPCAKPYLAAYERIIKRDLPGLKHVLDTCGQQSHRDADGRSLLHEAAWIGNENIVAFLMEVGIPATVTDNKKATPAHSAAEGKHAKILELLLKNGADPKAALSSEGYRPGWTVLHAAASSGCTACVTMLLDAGATPAATTKEVRSDGRTLSVSVLDEAMPHGDPLVRILKARGAKHGRTYKKAQTYNQKGLTAHRKGDFRSAAKLFSKATRLGVRHYTAQFNLACAYARLAMPSPKGSCQGRWFRKALQALETAAEWNHARTRTKAAKDSDFDRIRSYAGFAEFVTNTTFETATNLEVYLVDKLFESTCPGSGYCDSDELLLLKGYVAEGTHGPGTWHIEDRTLILTHGNKTRRLPITSPSSVGEMYWPDPNDMSGASERHAEASCHALP